MIYSYRNPAINRLRNYERVSGEGASYGGVALKAIYYVALTMIAAAASFILAFDMFMVNSSMAMVLLIGAPIIAFICAMIAAFKPLTAPVTGTLYAVFQGLAMGFISLIFETMYEGVVFPAIISTVSVLLIMLVLYSTGIIRVGAFFKKFIISALLGVLFSRLLILIIGIFSPAVYAMFFGIGNLSILVSVIMIIVASLLILFDLQRITEVVQGGLDKRYEWSAAFGLLVTLVWLYMEFLRLFAIIAARRR